MSAPAIRSETAPPAPGLPAEPLVTALRDGRIEGLAQLSPHAACLVPLLTALDWQGDLRQLSDALPHAVARFDLDDLLQALVVLGFDCRAVTGSVQALDPRNLPCLHVLADGTPRVVVRRRENDVLVFDGVLNRMDWQPAERRGGTAWLIAPAAATAPAAAARRQAERPGAWSADLKARLGRHLAPAVILTVALQGPILAVPFLLAAMLEAAAVDPAGAPVMLVVGLAGALVLEAALRVARGASLAFAGGRLGFALATAPIGHLLSLPAERVETAGLADQQARLAELEVLGRLVGGGSLGRALDVAAAPLAAIALMLAAGGAVLPVLLAGLAMGLVIRLGLPDAGGLLAEERRARRRRFVFLGDLVAARETVRASGDPRQWTDRLRPESADYAVAGLALHRHQAWRALVLAALAAGGVAGAVAVAPAAPGALLVVGWLAARSLVPLLALAGAALPAVEAGQALRLLDRLMRLAPEGAGADPTRPRPRLAGRLTLRGVVYGYHADAEPALAGIDLDVPPGQVVAVLGADGAGKSTLLRLIAGLGAAQAGVVAVDGQDVRRLDPRTLRQILSYLPPTSDLFHGTVAQNLRLADPLANDERLVHAAAEAGVLSAIMSLPAGFETKLGDVDPARIPPGFARGLALARALVRETPILLLDEPGRALDEPGDEALIERLGALRGRATVLLVTHRPAHVRAADRAIVLEAGSIVFDGAPAAALHRLS